MITTFRQQVHSAFERFPMRALVAAAVATMVLVTAGAWTTWRLYRDFATLTRTELTLRALIGDIVHYDEVLTMSARMSALAQDARWERRYREYEPMVDRA